MPGIPRLSGVFGAVGLFAWFAVSATSVARALTMQRLAVWACASVLFAVTFLAAQRVKNHGRVLLFGQTAAVIAMTSILCNGYEGFLLALIAAQLGWRESKRSGLFWIGTQTLCLGCAIAIEWTTRSAVLLAPPYLAFQLLTFALARLLYTEHELRSQLETAHRHALALQEELAQKSRLDERLKMTQELHDVFGHRLTALSLNLEAAAQVKEDRQSLLATAQSLVRVLLSDVKALVSVYKDEQPVDLIGELRALARDLPTPTVELTCPDALSLSDPRVARALLRCAQEFVTNAIRHGAASRVWIHLEVHDGTVCLYARDNGLGGDGFQDGFGISGMRRRIQDLGGVFEARAGNDHFEVTATLPLMQERAA